VTQLAKWKTASQMVALCLLLVGIETPVAALAGYSLVDVGVVLLWVAAGLTAVTGYDYLRLGLRHIRAAASDASGR